MNIKSSNMEPSTFILKFQNGMPPVNKEQKITGENITYNNCFPERPKSFKSGEQVKQYLRAVHLCYKIIASQQSAASLVNLGKLVVIKS